ncbi:MAG TPA: GNAT family N-acetyltransferase [Anaerolineales bacterium]|nr:GNAT family N-acetyltransferase [Anaerolineales bacterium]
MGLNDLDSTVHIHLSSFTGFFLSFMGPSFLREFYRTVFLDKSGIALVSEQDAEISGFAVGTTEPGGFYRRTVLNNWHRFLLASFIPVLKKPQTMLCLSRRLVTTTRSNYVENEALLLSIAVHPLKQARGIGKQLIKGFAAEAERRGATSISLLTDRLNNEVTNQFYLQAGFACTRSFITSEGRPMNEYQRLLVSNHRSNNEHKPHSTIIRDVHQNLLERPPQLLENGYKTQL